MSDIIKVPGLDPLVRLVGDEGASIEDSEYGYLIPKGRFRLAVGNFPKSRFIEYPGTSPGPGRDPVQIRKTPAGDYELTRADNQFFGYNSFNYSGRDERRAWLRWDFVLLRKLTGEPVATALLQDATLSLGVPRQEADDRRRIYYRARGHVIKSAKWKDILGFASGPRLQKTERGFEAVGRGPSGGAVLDEPEVARLNIPEEVELSFLMFNPDLSEPSPEDPVLRIRTEQPNPPRRIAFEVHPDTRLGLPEAAAAPWTQLTFDEVEVAGGWIRSTAYRAATPPAEVDLILRRLPVPAVGPGTRLWTTSRRLGLWFALDTSAPRTVQLVHHDPAVSGPVAEAGAREKYRGLWVHGLGSSRSPHARLDASVAAVTLDNATRRFEFNAGGELVVAGRNELSYLVPKPSAARGARVIDIPLGDASLGCSWRPGADTPFILDTATPHGPRLRAPGLRLVAPFLGALSAPDDAAHYDYLRLTPAEELIFQLTDEGAFPVGGRAWAARCEQAPEAQGFRVLTHPGAGVKFWRRSDPALKTKFDCRTVAGKETLVFSSAVAELSYRPPRAPSGEGDYVVSDRNVNFVEGQLDQGAHGEWVKRNQVNDLVVVYLGEAGKPGEQKIQDFVRNNYGGDPRRVLWPLGSGLSLLLMEKRGGRVRFAPEIARERARAKTSLGFDLSSPQPTNAGGLTGAITPEHFGEPAGTTWQTFAAGEPPLLWPRLLRPAGMAASSRLDPSDAFWAGVFFRDMPLAFNRPADIQSGPDAPPFLSGLLDAIERRLCLDYGWKDETGATWKAETIFEEDITAPGWAKLFRVFVHGFRTQGTNSRVVVADVELSGEIPVIKVRESDDGPDSDSLKFRGQAHFNLLEGARLDKLELNPGKEFFTRSIPGFRKLKFHRLATDLRKAELELSLTPDPALANIFPFLRAGDRPGDELLPVRTKGEMSLKGTASSLKLGLILPADQQTNLFGKFAATVQGAQLELPQEGAATLTFYCRLNFGVGGFTSVGARVVLRNKADGSGWESSVEVDENVQGSFDLAGFGGRLERVNWVEIEQPSNGGPVSSEDLGEVVLKREFRGKLVLLQGKGLLKNLELDCRIGTTGEMTYWAGVGVYRGLEQFEALKLGDVVVVVAHHADYKGRPLGRVLQEIVTSPIKESLRPGEMPVDEFLDGWQPSGEVGTFVAASGYLEVDGRVIASPRNRSLSDRENSVDATVLAFTDGGLMQVDAVAKLMGAIRVSFSITVDWQRGTLRASFGIPTPLHYPAPASPEISVQVGQMVLGVGFERFAFDVGLGWPEALGGNPLERDWSKSLMVRVASMYPVNTLWGGFRTAYQDGKFRLGWAMRAGWTRQFELGGDLAGVKAEFGVAVGGVMELSYLADDPLRPLAYVEQDPEFALLRETTLPAPLPWGHKDSAQAAVIGELDRIVTEQLSGFEERALVFRGEWYADVWGSASAQIFGVTVAGVHLQARVSLRVAASIVPFRLCNISGRASFSFVVRVGCFELTARASLDVVILDRPGCPALTARQSAYLLPAAS